MWFFDCLFKGICNGDNVSSISDNGWGLCGEGLFGNCFDFVAVCTAIQQLERIEFGARVRAILTTIGNDNDNTLCQPPQ